MLGIPVFYYDCTAALVVNDRLVAAAREERSAGKKHEAAFPSADALSLRGDGEYAAMTVWKVELRKRSR
jgi:predicted NodU family carbamoyl transferase